MARALYNILAKEDKLISGSVYTNTTLADAFNSIKDFSEIPANRSTAVLQCYANGILSGMTDGTFSGEASMTRAQACAVIARMRNLIGGGVDSSAQVPEQTPEQPPAETPDQTPAQEAEQEPEETPQQTSGALANGKPITTENVLEIMEEIQAQYPKGTAYLTKFCTNDYDGDVLNLIRQWKGNGNVTVSLTTGCAGYARMVSDTIFGATGFPAREVNNPSPNNVRPGDIIITYTDSSQKLLKHVGIVWKVQQNVDGVWRFSTTDAANANAGVTWPIAVAGTSIGSDQAVYTRYPE